MIFTFFFILKLNKKKIKFIASESKLTSDIIGELNLSREMTIYEIKSILESETNMLKSIDLSFSPYCICCLSNDRIVCSYGSTCLKIFDSELNLIETINNFDNSALFITTNNKDRIYISDSNRHQITMTDNYFNKINTVGSYGNRFNQFSNPWNLFYHNFHIYVCDYGNKRIQKLNADQLLFIKSYQLDYHPWQIIVNYKGDLACIRSFNDQSIRFYQLNHHDNEGESDHDHEYDDKFTLLYKYDDHNGYLSHINGYIYEMSFKNDKKVYCYNDCGLLCKEIETRKQLNDFIIDGWDGALVTLKNAIICSSYRARRLLLIKKL